MSANDNYSHSKTDTDKPAHKYKTQPKMSVANLAALAVDVQLFQSEADVHVMLEELYEQDEIDLAKSSK
jgi:hypothetical protein